MADTWSKNVSGQRGMGAVYLARDLGLHNKPIVIKILSQASLQDLHGLKEIQTRGQSERTPTSWPG